MYLKTSRVTHSYIDELLTSKEIWIRKKILESKNKIYIDKETLNIDEAKDYMSQRVIFLSSHMNLKYNELKFRRMKRRWGSCSSNKVITLNLYLYKTNKELIDYVIVHELAHLLHMNHSKNFHALVKSFIENSKELNKELNNYSLS